MAPGELTPKQQLLELLRSSRSVLITTHHNPDGDALGASLALSQALTKLGKQVTLATSGDMSAAYNFLPGLESIDRSFTGNKDLLIVLDESQAKIANVSLKRVAENKLIVVITPTEGILTAANVKIEDGSYTFDAVIVLDAASLDRIGSLYENQPNLFYEVPVANIDHHTGNTNFGKINLVDVTASSTAEIMVSLIEALSKEQPGLLNADIATCLLTGLMFDTSSFQNSNTTPKSLTVAAQLVAAGANQQAIVQNLYKTRSLATLRLWGRALSYIKEDTAGKFAWSSLSKADFVAAQATPEHLEGLVDDLLKSAVGMDFVALLSERNGDIHVNLRSTTPTIDVLRIAQHFKGGGHPQAAKFMVAQSKLVDKEQDIINQIRTLIAGRDRAAQPSQ